MDVVRSAAVTRGRNLEYVTVGWNSLEALIAVISGLIAGSIALVGFGFDSVIEVSSGVILLWRLQRDHDVEKREQREKRALQLVGISFIALAIYIAYDALKALWHAEAPHPSYPGIALATLSLLVMPALARAKRRVATTIESRALVADSRQTDICAYLSAILVGGLTLNALFGWWWADPIAALVMVPIMVKEGRDGLRGESCTDCH